jgi:hypothetical protein
VHGFAVVLLTPTWHTTETLVVAELAAAAPQSATRKTSANACRILTVPLLPKVGTARNINL